jgi:anaerobic glycerol-3-phosphate dehydrogenase
LSSSSRYTKIAVIGGGLAAHTAVATLERTGNIKVTHIYPSNPGATAVWSGAGQVFGPQTEFFPDSAGLVGAPSTPDRPVIRERGERWEELLERCEFHPFTRLGLSVEQTQKRIADALGLLPEWDVLEVPDERVLVSEHGSPLVADVACRTVAHSWVAPGESVAVARCPALVGWNAERIASAIKDSGEAEAQVLDVELLGALEGVDQHPVRLAKKLTADETSALGGDPDDFIVQFERAISGEVDALFLPPCIGESFEKAASVTDVLTEELGCRVAELSATRHSIHGWRTDRALRRERPATLRVRAKRVRADGPRWRVELDENELTVDAVILATGSWMGGGLPSRPPLREPLTGLDLWLDGAALEHPEQTWIPDELREQPWDDHPLFRVGVAIDEYCHPLNRRGEAEHERLFACGRMLAGFNRIWDGTTLGVDLVTGHLAAKHALDATGQTA